MSLPLFPRPRRVRARAGGWSLPAGGRAAVEGDEALTRPARRWLAGRLGPGWRILRADDAGVSVRFRLLPPSAADGGQSYRLTISEAGVTAEACGRAGLFYAAVTLAQIVRLSADRPLPCCEIEDGPDFPLRGVMLDISRDKVPTMETLYWLVDRFADMKLNHLQLYTEHAFAYRGHREVWQDASPLTAEEIRALDAYCAERCVELAPNQNSFGHMERWLAHPRYLPLAELPQGGAPLPWGGVRDRPTTLCPTDPRSFELLAGLYDELLPNFTSRLFNVGCDEPFDLRGAGRSRRLVERQGEGRVYLGYLLRLHEMVSARGFRMAFWDDILINHPELIPEVPKDALALEWGYEADHPFEAHGAALAAAGVPFCVCPGTSSWNSLTGRFDNMRRNLAAAATAGRRHGAAGYIVCDWGDGGHWHPLGMSFPAFACAAGISWRGASGRYTARAADSLLTEGLWQTLQGLGGVCRLCGATHANSTELFHILSKPATRAIPPAVTPAALRRARARLDAIEAAMPPSESALAQEARFAIRMARAACLKGASILNGDIAKPSVRKTLRDAMGELIEAHARVWRLRNREGGLADSAGRLARIRDEFE